MSHSAHTSKTSNEKTLPQLKGGLFLTDGGLETTLVFHNKIDLPYFAAFDLLKDNDGRKAIRDYYVPYIDIARENGCGFILDSATWRASADWGRKLGYSSTELANANRQSIAMLHELRDTYGRPDFPMVVSGAIGPRGDGYKPGKLMSAEAAEAYHSEQIGVFAATDADMIGAFTMNNINEAIGIARAAKRAGIASMISFTVETDSRLPDGHTLEEAVAAVDAATDQSPAYYMINCAHPTHFEPALKNGGAWLKRVMGIRANASTRSHAELDESTDLDAGNPEELAAQYRQLIASYPQFRVLGGCCGTDDRHIRAIGCACCGAPLFKDKRAAAE